MRHSAIADLVAPRRKTWTDHDIAAPGEPIVSWRGAASRPLPPHEITGPPDAPVVVVLGGISATRHVTATASDPTPGWWSSVVGDRAAIDTMRYRVLSFDYVDGGRLADGRPASIVTTNQQADILAELLDALEIGQAYALVGASYGGMVGLAFAARHPARLQRLIAISAPHESHPMSTALRTIQRRIVQLGLATGQPTSALSIARGLAMTTYRSTREFGERFTKGPIAGRDGEPAFEAGCYLEHCGDRFAEAFPPERFLALSLSSDLHVVDPSAIRAPTLIVAAEGDSLVPIEQLQELSARLSGPCRLARLRSLCGHDAFLTEPGSVSRLLTIALSRRAVT